MATLPPSGKLVPGMLGAGHRARADGEPQEGGLTQEVRVLEFMADTCVQEGICAGAITRKVGGREERGCSLTAPLETTCAGRTKGPQMEVLAAVLSQLGDKWHRGVRSPASTQEAGGGGPAEGSPRPAG